MFLACAPDPTPKEEPLLPDTFAFARVDDDGLGPVAGEALARMPAWLRPDLELALRGVDADVAEALGTVVVELDDPALLDEVGFALAHLSPEVLRSRSFHPELVVENARRIYEADPLLDYVELVEVGDPEVDADWHTTARYRVEVEGVIEEREIAREDYYWYVVHPRIEDENPWYIDAWTPCTRNTLECASNPESGTFWRSFLWEQAAETCPEGDACPVVPEYLMGKDVLWGAADGDDAVHAVAAMLLASPGEQGRWFNFGAYGERSIQPARIYALGRGNCGEWADMTTAIARTALIPNVNVTPASWDHTWNAVLVDRWIAYEPVNWWFDHPYGSGYTTWAAKGDAGSFFQTEQYAAETATLEIAVTDAAGAPVDGAAVVLWTPFGEGWSYAGEQLSDVDGVARFPVGADKEIGYIVRSPLGEYPGGNTLDRATTGMAAGSTERVQVTLGGTGPTAPTASPVAADGPTALTVTVDATGRSQGTSLRFGDTTTAVTSAPPLSTWVLTEAGYAAFLAGEAFETLEGALDPAGTHVVVVHNGGRNATAATGSVTVAFGESVHTEPLALPAGAHLALRVTPAE
jgi:hypothetical protein